MRYSKEEEEKFGDIVRDPPLVSTRASEHVSDRDRYFASQAAERPSWSGLHQAGSDPKGVIAKVKGVMAYYEVCRGRGEWNSDTVPGRCWVSITSKVHIRSPPRVLHGHKHMTTPCARAPSALTCLFFMICRPFSWAI
jgi:hypothetical protein